MTLKRYPGINVIMILFLLYCGTAFADIKINAPWSVEVTPNYNPIYGSIIGVTVKDGDYVGLFDENGNCYGVGLVRGNKYFASAYWQKPAHGAVDDDYTDRGFENGDRVFFKVYRQDDKKEFELTPQSGKNFYFLYEDAKKDMPVKMDLVYDRGFHVEVAPPSPDDEAEAVSGEAEEKLKDIEKEILAREVVKEELLARVDDGKDVTAPGHYEEYNAIDRDGGDSYEQGKSSKPAAQVTSPAGKIKKDERLTSISQVTGKQDKDKKMVLTKTVSAEPVNFDEASGGTRGLPPYLILILTGSALIVIAIFMVFFKKKEKEDDKI